MSSQFSVVYAALNYFDSTVISARACEEMNESEGAASFMVLWGAVARLQAFVTLISFAARPCAVCHPVRIEPRWPIGSTGIAPS